MEATVISEEGVSRWRTVRRRIYDSTLGVNIRVSPTLLTGFYRLPLGSVNTSNTWIGTSIRLDGNLGRHP
jgi:hypothetical protein